MCAMGAEAREMEDVLHAQPVLKFQRSEPRVRVTDEIQLSSILADQREAFLREGAPTVAKRRADLLKLKNAILARRKDYETAINADFGRRPAHETAIMEIMPLIQGINYLQVELFQPDACAFRRSDRFRPQLHAPVKVPRTSEPVGTSSDVRGPLGKFGRSIDEQDLRRMTLQIEHVPDHKLSDVNAHRLLGGAGERALSRPTELLGRFEDASQHFLNALP
jgi:hypothetical protein